MKLTMLGTGNATVTEVYNTCFVVENEGDYLLVDAGGGNEILRRLKAADIDWKRVRHIFVTHKHIDHILGIIWLVRMIAQNMNQGNYDGEAYIYAHDEVAALIEDMAGKLLQKKQAAMIGDRLHLIAVKDGETRQIIGRDVTFFDIQSTKAKQFGFCMDMGGGERLTCCGDEPYNDCEEQYAKGCTWLLHEAFCLHGQADVFHPYEKHHSTVKDACELAERLGVKHLVLYHTEDKTIAQRKQRYMAEGQQYYHGDLHVPDDMETLTL